MARPPSPDPAKVRVCTVTARLTAVERAELEALAAEWGLTVSQTVARLIRRTVDRRGLLRFMAEERKAGERG